MEICSIAPSRGRLRKGKCYEFLSKVIDKDQEISFISGNEPDPIEDWTFEEHSQSPDAFRRFVFVFMACVRRFQEEIKWKIPKAIIGMIIKQVEDYGEDEACEKTLKSGADDNKTGTENTAAEEDNQRKGGKEKCVLQ